MKHYNPQRDRQALAEEARRNQVPVCRSAATAEN